MKICVMTWGNSAGWKEIQYKYNGKTFKSKIALPLLEESENFDKIIILSTDSLAAENNKVLSVQNYSQLLSLVEEKIRDYIINELNFEKIMNKMQVIVSFATGDYGELKIQGKGTDFYYHIFYELSKLFAQMLLNDNDLKNDHEIKVIIDITHGINYMPVNMYTIVRLILNVFGFFFKNIKINVVNSDPFIGRVNPDCLNINIIEETFIIPRVYFVNDKDLSRSLIVFKDLDNERKRTIGIKKYRFENSEKELYKKTLLFLASFYHKLPLHVIHYLPKAESIMELTRKIFEEFFNFISLSKSDNKIVLTRELSLNNHVENLSKAFILSLILDKMGIKNDSEIKISDVEKVNDHLFREFQIEKNRTDVELDNIRKEDKGKIDFITNDYETYIEIENKYRKKNGLNKLNSGEIRDRNFFAHAGFEYNSIKLRKEGSNIFIKVNEDYEDKIVKFLIS